MAKFISRSNNDKILNSKIKSQLDESKIKKIRKTLLSLTEMDIKTSKLYNVIVIKKVENENISPITIPQRNNHEDLGRENQNEINIENETDFDRSELASSSDFENENDEF